MYGDVVMGLKPEKKEDIDPLKRSWTIKTKKTQERLELSWGLKELVKASRPPSKAAWR
jgi:hypothetical protein